MYSEFPTKIYKYRSWKTDFDKELIKDNILFLTSPKYFNDPFDCRIPDNIYSLNTDLKIKEYVELSINKLIDLSPDESVKRKKDFYDQIKNDIDKFHIKLENIVYDRQNTYSGVLSFSAIWNNILMWSHYANNHKGYCVGLIEEKIRKNKKVGMFGLVNYDNNDDYPFINPLEQNIIQKSVNRFQNKARNWKYEEEYRISKLFYPISPTDEDRKLRFENDCYTEITLGINISKEDKEEIIDIGRRKNIKIYQATKIPLKFRITRIEI